jgi:site-specific DNA-methyltransferase (adenine-specific)
MDAGSIDAIITDLPYGTTACKWDSVIPFAPMWEVVKHVLKPRGAFVTTASQPFTSALVMSNPQDFKEEVIWDKKIPSGMSYARFMHMRQHENILVFCDGRMTYNPQTSIRDIAIKGGGMSKGETTNNQKLIALKKTYATKQPTTIISFDKIRRGSLHPTQKPVALYEYLIRTYTNEGETVLDMTMGSGTTGVACMNTGRNFVGIERDAEYFKIAERRIQEAKQ